MKSTLLFVMEALQVNGASKSLLSLLKAISGKYDISLFLFSHEGEMLGEIPPEVKLLPEIPEYRVLSQQMKYAVIEALKHGNWGLAWFRFRIFLERALKMPFCQWHKLPEIKGNWQVVCSYADGFVASTVINKVIGGKKVLWVHENYENNPKPREVLNSFLKSDAIAGVSGDAILHLANILGENIKRKAHVIHNIVDSNLLQRMASQEDVTLPGPDKNIVSVGRISPEKGYDLIPAIVELLVQAGLDVHWSIIGSGLETVRNSAINDAKRRGVASRIHFFGEKFNPHPYTKAADCFVQLSRHEGWCMTISEALALGTPVVVSDIEVFHEQVVDGENGYFATDVESFAKAIRQVLNDSTFLSHKCSVKLPCSPENVKCEFSAMLRSVCRDNP